MILGIEDIAGGAAIVSFLIWLGFTALFYLVCYVAALNVIDDLTKNSVVKIPAVVGAAAVSAGLMSVFNYKPLALFLLMAVSNFFRVKKLVEKNLQDPKGFKISIPLHNFASYGYILLVPILAFYFQSRTWLPD